MIEFNKATIAPPKAKWINIYNSNGEKIGIIPLGGLRKPKNMGEKLYSFAVCSDLHIGQDATTISKFEKFLNYCESNKDIKFILNCGDSAYHSTTVPNPNLTALNALETEYNNLSEQNYEIFLEYCKTMRERTYKNSKGEIISRLAEWDNKKNKSSKNWKNFNKIKNELFSNPFISIAGNHEHWMYELQEFLIEYYDFENGNYYKFSRPVREPKSEYPIVYSTLNNSNISNIDEFIFDIETEKYYKKINSQLVECDINYSNIWELNEIDDFNNIENPINRQAIWDSERQEVYYYYNNLWNLIKLHNNQAIYLKQSKKFLNQFNNSWIDFTEEMEDELHYLKRYTSEKGEPFYYLILNNKETIQLLSSIEFNNLNESEQLEILKNVSDIILGNSTPAYTSKSGISYQGYSWKRDTLTVLHKYYEKFKNKRMFVLQHLQPEFLNKENGFPDLPLYEEGENKGLINPISQEASYKYVPLSLQQHYKNTITFHGHKHWGLNSAATNHFDEKNEKFGFNVVNIPSLEEKCEGYLVDVYKNYIHIYGVTFKENNKLEFNAKRSYLVDTTIQEIAPMSYQPNI